DVNRIFEPKFTTKNSGMGLGLGIIKNIIENYKGTITFETKYGEGTTFIVSLPIINT
ncbi:MAG: HAMP domain-containing histidine kinase, partial [Flavobacterium sp.]|nr:HAMP domain-containing histidine kinase [Flavobacterium sp.]